MKLIRDSCPYCEKTKDSRALMCRACRNTKFPPRKGTGAAYHLHPGGYKWIMINGKAILEHRHVMQLFLGRALDPDEHVHHVNGIKGDNRLENLVVLSEAEHHSLHSIEMWNRRNAA